MPADFALAMDLDRVTKVLREFEGCPAVARKMFSEGLAKAISQDDGAARHEYQQRFLAATQNVLRDAQQSAVDNKAACVDSVQKARVELETQREVSAGAAKAEQDARTEAESKSQLLQEAKQQVARTEREHKECEETKDRLCAERDQIKQEKAQHSAIADGSLRMLVEGGWEDEEIKSAVIEVVQLHLGTCKADEVLIAAAPSALGTKPEKRHPFDVLTVECIAEVFKAQENKIAQRLAEGEAQEEVTRAHALGMWAVADVARDAYLVANSQSETADASLEKVTSIAQTEAKKTTKQEKTVAGLQSQHVSAGELEQEVVDASVALERLIVNEYEAKMCGQEIAEDSTMAVDIAAEIPVEAAASAAPIETQQPAMEVDMNEIVVAPVISKVDDCAPVAMATTNIGGA